MEHKLYFVRSDLCIFVTKLMVCGNNFFNSTSSSNMCYLVPSPQNKNYSKKLVRKFQSDKVKKIPTVYSCHVVRAVPKAFV